ncbi:MAG: GH116 family glycosyl-hydrolase, partial [Armatimonadota bacterium]
MSRVYTGEHLNKVAFPLGGIGAGMICIEGTGSFSHLSVKNAPNVFHEPYAYSALCIKGKENIARVLEGPVPMWKAFGQPGSGNGLGDRTYGYPRFDEVSFHARFPFGIVDIDTPEMPVHVEITAWSPFIPTDSDNSSLPVAAVEYKIVNISDEDIDSVYSFNCLNFLKSWSGNDCVKSTKNGFILHESGAEDKPWDLADFCVRIDEPEMAVNCQYFRGGGFDAPTMAWKAVEEGAVISKPEYTEGGQSPGGSIYVPFKLKAGRSKTIKLMFSWYVPNTNQRHGLFEEKEEALNCNGGKCEEKPKETYKPWYTVKFKNVEEIAEMFSKEYDELRAKTLAFTEAFYDSTLPEDVLEAVSANLSILKSPTAR